MKIAVIADIHFGGSLPVGSRRCDIADILTKRAVLRLNRLIKPDVTLVLGDIINDGEAGDAQDDLKQIRSLLDTLESPYIAIPGNHDGDTAQFYRVFERPAEIIDIAGVRFLPFIDKDEPGYWASRGEADIRRIREAGTGHKGPIVSLQHVCLCPPGDNQVTPYNYTNAEEIIRAMRAAGVHLSISGHHHQGADNTWDGDVMFVNAPGVCQAPFSFVVINISGDHVETQLHELAAPARLQLVDNHVHTQLAYCAENMDVERTVSLAKDFGLAGVRFTEHSGQLYFDRKPYWRNAWLAGGVAAAEDAHDRMRQYMELKQKYQDDFASFSLEVECDEQGDLLLKQRDVDRFEHLLGTIHALPGLTEEAPPGNGNCEDFIRLVEAMCAEGISVLAHPLRVFGRLGWEVPEQLFDMTAEVLAGHGVAAELNFHSTHRPDIRFVRACLKRGVAFSFGSDSHNLAEIGDFASQLSLLAEAGYDGDVTDVLWSA